MAPTVLKFMTPRFRKKIALFDYDETLIRPKDGRRFPKDVDDYMWAFPDVPKVLQETYDKGFMIIICTQQSKLWKVDQIKAVLGSLHIPMYAAVALDKADYKPSTVLFDVVMQNYKNKTWSKESSFFVGDALGRDGDWSNTDRLFAEALQVQWKTPESYFNPKTKMQHITRKTLFNSDDYKLWMICKNKFVKTDISVDPYIGVIANDASYITKDIHIQLLQWKMSQGKTRPMLMKYAKELTETDVQTTSTRAFALCKDGKYMEAVETYKTLKGTGYALASLVLSCVYPNIAFMSDELLGLLYPESKFTYNKKEFTACYTYTSNKAGELTQKSNALWSARDVEICLRNLE